MKKIKPDPGFHYWKLKYKEEFKKNQKLEAENKALLEDREILYQRSLKDIGLQEKLLLTENRNGSLEADVKLFKKSFNEELTKKLRVQDKLDTAVDFLEGYASYELSETMEIDFEVSKSLKELKDKDDIK